MAIPFRVLLLLPQADNHTIGFKFRSIWPKVSCSVLPQADNLSRVRQTRISSRRRRRRRDEIFQCADVIYGL
jgi:hypothetical protein